MSWLRAEGETIHFVTTVEDWELLRSSAALSRVPVVALFVASWAKASPLADSQFRAEVEALMLRAASDGEAGGGGVGAVGGGAAVPLVARVDVAADDELEELAGEVNRREQRASFWGGGGGGELRGKREATEALR